MSIRAHEDDEILIGTLWKHIYTDRENPNLEASNPDFIVRKTQEDGYINFIRNDRFNTQGYGHDYSKSKFVKNLVPLKTTCYKDRTRLLASLSQVVQCINEPIEIHDILIEMDI